MRRILTASAAAFAIVGLFSACSTSSSKSSSSTTASTASAASKDDASCLVGTWSASAKDLGFFNNSASSDETYSTPTGSVQFEFTENGNFQIRFDNVQSIYTSGGASVNVAFNGSVGGTYTAKPSNKTLTTNTTKYNVSITSNGVALDATSFNNAIRENDKESQGYSCSGGELTLRYDDGTKYTLKPA